MNFKKRLILVGTLALALGMAGAVTAFALAADDSKDKPPGLDDADGAADATPGLPSYDEGETDSRNGTVVTSIDDIDPNVCNAIHNINACTPEELKELGMAPTTGSIAVGESYPAPNPEAKPEPLFEDGELQSEVQSLEEADQQDCELAGGSVYVSTDGGFGCVIVHDLEDGGGGETPAQPPVVVPEPEVLPSAE